jgi:hypothetical protein
MIRTCVILAVPLTGRACMPSQEVIVAPRSRPYVIYYNLEESFCTPCEQMGEMEFNLPPPAVLVNYLSDNRLADRCACSNSLFVFTS